MRKLILITIITVFSIICRGQELNTIGNFGGIIISANYSIAPVPSLAPTDDPLSMFGVGIGFVTNKVVELGIYANKSLPTANYMTGYTLTADTINISYNTRDLKIGLSYFIYAGNENMIISPYVQAGIGDMQIHRVDFYSDNRKTLLEEAFLIQAEVGVKGCYIVQNSFMVSLGVSYLFSTPDRLLINLSSKEMNMFKITAGISLGILNGDGGGKSNKRKRRR